MKCPWQSCVTGNVFGFFTGRRRLPGRFFTSQPKPLSEDENEGIHLLFAMALLGVHRSKGHHALLCDANDDDGSKRARVPAWEEQLAVIGVPDTERGSEDATVNSDNENDMDDQPGDGGNGEWRPGSGAGGGGSGSGSNRGGRGGGKESLRRLARINAGRRRGSSKTNVTGRMTAMHYSDSRPVLKARGP
ncbi:hypothetical protein K439DRAFT_224521 [Ramaria rubella]|nr:hypothetical protein K439DRAFT_224521 [Ramaria rubella]